MASKDDYWAGWMDGWAGATNAIFAQHRTSSAEPAPARAPSLETARPDSAGDKPAAARSARPATAAALAAPTAPRKRGRPPKHRAP
jgi:hypothetical protein